MYYQYLSFYPLPLKIQKVIKIAPDFAKVIDYPIANAINWINHEDIKTEYDEIQDNLGEKLKELMKNKNK